MPHLGARGGGERPHEVRVARADGEHLVRVCVEGDVRGVVTGVKDAPEFLQLFGRSIVVAAETGIELHIDHVAGSGARVAYLTYTLVQLPRRTRSDDK